MIYFKKIIYKIEKSDFLCYAKLYRNFLHNMGVENLGLNILL